VTVFLMVAVGARADKDGVALRGCVHGGLDGLELRARALLAVVVHDRSRGKGVLK